MPTNRSSRGGNIQMVTKVKKIIIQGRIASHWIWMDKNLLWRVKPKERFKTQATNRTEQRGPTKQEGIPITKEVWNQKTKKTIPANIDS